MTLWYETDDTGQDAPELAFWDDMEQRWRPLPAAPHLAGDVIALGIAPRPRNAREGFLYHLCHGLLMRYPLLDVLVFSWRNRASFSEGYDPDKVVDALEGELTCD